MNRIFASLPLFCALLVVAPLSASAVAVSWTPVGNLGNAAHAVVMMTAGTSGHGSVPYNYSIDGYDVTKSQHVEILNAKDPTGADPLGLYNGNMSSAPYGGINCSSGAANGNKYSVILGNGNHPINYENWFDAIRFADWPNNGQGSGSTETGACSFLGGTPTPTNSIAPNARATMFLPNENEWYKAPNYNPGANSYDQYPASSHTMPVANGPTAPRNDANFSLGAPLSLTDVGAYPGTTSPYGLVDMGSNVFQRSGALITNGTGTGACGSVRSMPTCPHSSP